MENEFIEAYLYQVAKKTLEYFSVEYSEKELVEFVVLELLKIKRP